MRSTDPSMNAVLTFPDPAEQIPGRPVGSWAARDVVLDPVQARQGVGTGKIGCVEN
jgi:hypothetical protein